MPADDLRPMSVIEIMDRALQLYRRRFITFLAVALIIYIPVGAAVAYIEVAQQHAIERAIEADRLDELQQVLRTGTIINIATAAITFLIISICTGALIHVIAGTYLGESIGALEAYRRALPRVLLLVVVEILALLIIGVGLVLLIIPGIIFMLMLFVRAPVVMLERQGVLGSLERSRRLMKGNLLRALGLTILLVLLVGVITMAIMFGLLGLFGHTFIAYFLGQMVEAVFVPFSSACLVLFYYDLRIRKEAFDLEQLAESIA